ncbi:cytochrome P450 [Streptomyces sp. TYQ1024]|nr:cytochrome P450 [Streptomyces sp. TYQ1024]
MAHLLARGWNHEIKTDGRQFFCATPPAQVMARRARTTLTLAGLEVEAGHLVVAVLGAANRDSGRFTDPDRFDVTRDEGPRLSFASGAHSCLGSHLARLRAESSSACFRPSGDGSDPPGPRYCDRKHDAQAAEPAGPGTRGLNQRPASLPPSNCPAAHVLAGSARHHRAPARPTAPGTVPTAPNMASSWGSVSWGGTADEGAQADATDERTAHGDQ